MWTADPNGARLLMKVITTAVRAQGDIVLCSAMTGLAALNHEGGTMAHATYKIPVTGSEEIPQCSVTARSERAELLRAAALHIWDEFPSIHQKNFEAVSNWLCDVTGSSAPCGGRVFVCCGDFRQIPPVIPGGGRSTIVEASIPSSPLWSSFAWRNLTHPQRDVSNAEYSWFIDRIDDGEVESTYSIQSDTNLLKLELMAVTTSQ
jgi:ATP-dependent DNA helicase PIF1